MRNIRLIAQTKIQDYVEYYSENPLKAIWDELLLITDINVLKREWPEQEENSYLYVMTSVKQSYEYYQASQACSVKTKPLLLYYCFLNLTRAILFIETNEMPNSTYHGLMKFEVNNEILKSSARTNDGLFKELLQFGKYDYANGMSFSFEQFIRSIPELEYEIKLYFNIDSYLINTKITNYINGDIEIFIPNEKFNSNNSYQRLKDDFDRKQTDDGNIFFKIANSSYSEEKLRSMNVKLIGKYFVFSQLEYSYYFQTEENPIPIYAAYYGAMFLLSSLVRYHPIEILNFTSEHSKHSSQWFINFFCDLSSRVYPNLMLNILYGKQVRYS